MLDMMIRRSPSRRRSPDQRARYSTFKRYSCGCLAALLVVSVLYALQAPEHSVPQEWKAALVRVSADSLRGHVSFLASDLLEGRSTPSRSLDITAEYIASQYRRAALAPGGDRGFFQSSERTVLQQNHAGFECTIRVREKSLSLPAEHVAIEAPEGLELIGVQILKVNPEDASGLSGEDTQGKVIMVKVPDQIWEPQNLKALLGLTSIMSNWQKLKPALLVMVDPSGSTALWVSSTYVVRPGPRSLSLAVIVDKELTSLLETLPYGVTPATVSLSLQAPVERRVGLKNVIGTIAGSDPSLRDTCVVLSAHYDHLEPAAVGDGDRILNGANDDASGVAGLLELASVLNELPRKPRRTIVFAAFFGEEKGRLGSAAYLANPPCPLQKTIANINLEQIGRTDSNIGPVIDSVYLTGFDYSDVGGVFADAGRATGVNATRDEKNSERYFRSGDSANFALRGIPAHSASVAFQYSDYHMPGDEWEKLDYANMAKVTRTIGMTILMLADSDVAPKWDANNAQTASYLEAQRRLLAK